jgi:hypothetical protein
LIACSSRSLRARPNRKSTRFASHHAIKLRDFNQSRERIR